MAVKLRLGHTGVVKDVVQQASGDHISCQTKFCQNLGSLDAVNKDRLAVASLLPRMRVASESKSPQNNFVLEDLVLCLQPS